MKKSKDEMFTDEKIPDKKTKCKKMESFVHNNIKFQSLTCVLCNVVMFHQIELATHMDFHLNENKYTKKITYHLKSHKCPFCDYTASTRNHLKQHFDCIHNQLKPHKCPMCDYTAFQKGQLKMHIDSVHNQLKPHKCQICDFKTSQKGNLKLHIDSVHNKLKPHKCPLCDYTASQKNI